MKDREMYIISTEISDYNLHNYRLALLISSVVKLGKILIVVAFWMLHEGVGILCLHLQDHPEELRPTVPFLDALIAADFGYKS